MADEAVEPKIVLLMRLLGALDEGTYDFEGLKAQVSEQHPPSTRSLRRYLATLTEAGYPWYFDREHATYKFREGYAMRRVQLSGSELLGLLTMRGLAQSLGGELAASVDDATRKLIGVADHPATHSAQRPSMRIHVSGLALDPDRRAAFELLQKAQRDTQTARFTYVDKRGKTSQRTVDPYGFVVSSGRAYLVAYDHTRGAKRVFALDGISAARLGARRFDRPADFDIEAFAARSISGIMHSSETLAITVRFSSVVASAAKADRIVRDRTVADRTDGSVDITYEVADAHELVRWTLRWGEEAEVIAPADVRAMARDVVDAIAARYERNGER